MSTSPAGPPAGEGRVNQVAYDAVAAAYEERKQADPLAPWSRRLQAALLRRVRPGATVLDLGCGHGFEVASLRAAGLDVHGIDLSLQMLHTARRRAPGRLVQADLAALPVRDRAVDAVWSLHALLHVDDLAAALSEVVRVLAPGGAAALTFAVGSTTTHEAVPYQPAVQRRFVHRPVAALRRALGAAGLVERDAGLERDARPTFWVLADRR